MNREQFAQMMLGIAALAPVCNIARAEVYMTEEQAAKTLFPGVKLDLQVVDLSDATIDAIEKASDEKVREKKVRVWWGKDGEAVIIDKVLGKHEFITYAAAIDGAGKVKGLEILEYRETYGGQVKRPEWRAQFAGKTKADPLKIDKDIKNISGATLSSVHVTGGMRRLLKTYDFLKPATSKPQA